MVGADLVFDQLHDTFGAELDGCYEVDGMVPDFVGEVPNSDVVSNFVGVLLHFVGSEKIVLVGVPSWRQILGSLSV